MACGGIAHAISGEDENQFDAGRAAATGSHFQHANYSRRLLSLSAVLEGRSRDS
jgi:hypothetical protein